MESAADHRGEGSVHYAGASDVGAVVNATGVWVAAYTKPRQEKALASDLERLGVRHFLPLVERVVFSGGRRRRRMLPLFPSYLFFLGDEDARLPVMTTDRVVQIVRPPKGAEIEFAQQLRSLELALLHDPSSVELHPRVVEGARVTIRAGVMKGVTGTVTDCGNRAKVWLQVTALGTGALVEAPADFLELSE